MTEGWVRYKSSLFIFITFDKQEANQQRRVGRQTFAVPLIMGAAVRKPFA
jgi:hypothetical protein